MAFCTTSSHYKYKVTLYGLFVPSKCSTALLNDMLRKMLGKFIITYTDNIFLIYSSSIESHINHVKEVLSHLQENQLYVRRKKCKVHTPTITFLRYIFSQEGIIMDNTKVRTVTEWPIPCMIKGLHRSLDFANFYRCFIRGFSSVEEGPQNKFSWSTDTEEAFDKLKTTFTMVPIIRYLDLTKSFTRGGHLRNGGGGHPVTAIWRVTQNESHSLFLEKILFS